MAVKVDEDFKRYYPYDELASTVLGFTGADNQGIIGLEVKYEEYLKGQDGTILTTTTPGGSSFPGRQRIGSSLCPAMICRRVLTITCRCTRSKWRSG